MRSHTRVVEAIDVGEQEVREEAMLQINEIEAWRNRELDKLKKAKLALLGRKDEPRRKPSERIVAPKRGRRGKRRKPASTSVKSVAERRENVFRFVSESAEPVASGELIRALDMSSHSVHTALGQLLRERRITRLGSSASTRYAPRTGLPTSAGRNSGRQATLQGRIVTTIEDRGYASAEELGQALGEPVDRVLEVCGALQAEEEIHMAGVGAGPSTSASRQPDGLLIRGGLCRG